MKAILVSHSHWDREWYRTFEDFRSRLVDLVDRVIELCEADPGYRFLLDGQTVVLEDYLEIRPERAESLRRLCREGRIAIGPWYVQPDSLLPSGEAHVRNLLLGRRVGEAMGPVSRVGYTPDSFGHPAQFPQLFAGFGIDSFIYWRGNGNELDELPSEYLWEAPDGSRVLACHLGKGYFNAATSPGIDLGAVAELIGERARGLVERTRSNAVLLLNGLDHAPPEARTRELAAEIERATGFEVERGLLDDYVRILRDADPDRPVHRGELLGARIAPLLPGVWSTRTWIKLENRRAETALEGWAEPFAALARRFGLEDERPALRLAWKALLKNQAHDSICGCSRDEVHEQMRARFDTARELAEQTARRCLERLAGQSIERLAPRSTDFDLFVANPAARPRTDLVRFPLDFHPYVTASLDPLEAMHPTVLQDLEKMRFSVNGKPARLVAAEAGRMKFAPERRGFDLEFVATDVPAMGFRSFRVRREADDFDALDRIEQVEPGTTGAAIGVDGVRVCVSEEGLFEMTVGNRTFSGLGELEDTGDRGDTYDYDEVREGPGLKLESMTAERRLHPGGVQELRIVRRFTMPAGLDGQRDARSELRVPLVVGMLLRLVPGTGRLDLELGIENSAKDHRLRILFPVGGAIDRFTSQTTFDLVSRKPAPADDDGWMHPAPSTFPHQGFVHANGLSVVAPGLHEAELIPGDPSRIAITLLRCVGSLSRPDLRSRPGPAGPGTDTPKAQCPGTLRARIALFEGLDGRRARDAELGLLAVVRGDEPAVSERNPLLSLDPPQLILSALKPADQGEGLVLRIANPGADSRQANVGLGFPFEAVEACRLDESALEPPFPIQREGRVLRFDMPPHTLRTLRIH